MLTSNHSKRKDGGNLVEVVNTLCGVNPDKVNKNTTIKIIKKFNTVDGLLFDLTDLATYYLDGIQSNNRNFLTPHDKHADVKLLMNGLRNMKSKPYHIYHQQVWLNDERYRIY